jgi:hypothetical protein
VALTRARDRLYLSASLSAGVIRPTKGSLGEVLPGFVRNLFAQASSEANGCLIPADLTVYGRT